MTTRTFCLGRGTWFNLAPLTGQNYSLEIHDLNGAVTVEGREDVIKEQFLSHVALSCKQEKAIIDAAKLFLTSDDRMVDVYRKDLAAEYYTYTPGVPLAQKHRMNGNRVLDADSYKLSHISGVYPAEISGMFSYGSARVKSGAIVFVGLQMWLMKTWLDPLTRDEIDEAEKFASAHGEPFDRKPWDKIIDVYDGMLPVTIRALPEGTVTKGGIPLYTIECTDPDLYWLATYLETSMQRGIWYPTTIASNDLENYRICKRYLNESAETLDLLPFMLHDFGGRGVSSEETAQIGGMAHLVYFMGSDTISGVRAANWYYDSPMAAFSVAASEHSVQTAYGKLGQIRYLNAMLDRYAKPGTIVSIVLDGYDVYREAATLCNLEFREKVIASGARVVFRPDSGNPLEVIPRLLEMQASTYGYTINSKGYKVINHVGIIQGDGINTETMEQILDLITSPGLNYSAQNIVFGSGGALLQKVNRDTYKFAQKASAIKIGQNWIGIAKDPITDPGKTSKAGRLTAVKWNLTGEHSSANMDQPISNEFEDLMQTVFENGKLVVRTNLEEIRARARSRY